MADDPTPTPAVEPADKTPTPGDDGGAKFTQDQVNRLVQERLTRQERAFEKKMEAFEAQLETARQEAASAFLEERGLTEEDLAKLSTVDEEKLALKRELAKIKGAATKATAAAEAEAVARAKVEARHADMVVRSEVLSASSGKLSPGSEALLLPIVASKIKVVDGSTVVLDDKGEPSELTVADLVTATIEKYPQLAAPSVSYGSGSRPGFSGAPPSARDRDTPEARQAILAKMLGA